MKKTIIYYGSFTLPDCNAAAHRVTSIGKIFRELGYNTVFLGVERSGDSFDGIKPVANSYGFDMFELANPVSTLQWVKHISDTSGLELLLERYPDTAAIILYNSPYQTVCCASALAKRHGIKLIYDCTEWCDVTEGSFAKTAVKKLDAWFVRRLMPRKVDSLIVISKLMEKHYRDMNKPVLRLTPMVDINDPIWNAEPYASRHLISFCFAGTIDSTKEFLNLIVRAFLEVKNPNAGLDVIGVDHDDFKKNYPDIAIDSKTDKITFWGRLSHSETIQHVLGSDYYIFVRPRNLRNMAGFPTKFTEATTAGVPILTTDVSDVGQYIGHSVKGIIIPELTVEAIRSAIEDAAATCDVRSKADRPLCNVFDYRSGLEKTSRWLKEIL